MSLTLQFIEIEELSAIVMALGWLIGAKLCGALNSTWFDRARQADLDSPVLGVVSTLVPSWAIASLLFELGKAIVVAAVILPVGGWLAFDLPTAVEDVGGMLATVVLWRTALLRLGVLP